MVKWFFKYEKNWNKFQINTKKKENKIDLNDKSIFNIFNLECNLIKIAGSWDSNQKNDKKWSYMKFSVILV